MDVLKICVGQIPEAIFFALFIIFTKQIKSKQILFTILTVLEYLLLIYATKFTIWFHISFFMMTYVILKMLYKEKSQITDIFIMGIASLTLMVSCGLPLILYFNNLCDYTVYAILTRVVAFSILFMVKNKLPNIQNIYKKYWNRNDKIKKKMKSATFRCLNLVIFNFMFYIINFSILYYIWYNTK